MTRPDADRSLKRALAFLAPKEILRFAEPKSRGEMARGLLNPWLEGANEPKELIRFQIQDFLLEHLGDPRLNAQRWQEAGEQATGLMRRWLTRASLKAFFSLISDHALDIHWRFERRFGRRAWKKTRPSKLGLLWEAEYMLPLAQSKISNELCSPRWSER